MYKGRSVTFISVIGPFTHKENQKSNFGSSFLKFYFIFDFDCHSNFENQILVQIWFLSIETKINNSYPPKWVLTQHWFK